MTTQMPMNTLPWDNSTWEVAAQIAVQARRNSAAVLAPFSDDAWLGAPTGMPPVLRASIERQQLLVQTVIVPGETTSEGKLIEAVTVPWFDIVELLQNDPSAAFQIPPERWEEIVAGAYHRARPDRAQWAAIGGEGTYGHRLILRIRPSRIA